MEISAKPQEQHLWLQQLVGEWHYESEAHMGPDQPPMKASGTESVRSVGDLWVQCEGRGQMPGGEPVTTFMTLGYDASKGTFVGTFIASMMSYLWVYDGSLDAAKRVLTLTAQGPSFVAEGRTAQYRDVIELVSADHRVMTSHALGDDGKWTLFMTANYKRNK